MPDLVEIGQAVRTSSHLETIKVLLYGKFGTRKTLQIAHLIDLVGSEHVTILSAEKGLSTIQSRIDPERLIEVDNKSELRAAWARVKAIPKGDWLCVDGATNIFNWTLNEHMSGADRYYEAKAIGKEPERADQQFGRFISDKSQAIDPMKVYNRIGRDLEIFIQEAVRLDCHQYWTFLEDMTGSNGREKTIPYGPDVPGRVALRALLSKFDYIGRLVYDTERRLVAGFDPADAMYLARTRDDRSAGVQVPETITSFNLADFVRLITGGK